ncbi:hypothetical protein GLOIN_2v1784405 [Rhizophagus irregularis DAOM 181602=DAOM 197198]|nr:hypothetical protein GLOIN_2v1784405 [Rhizophagus irregularis DAOM 181602=DAOM 197198]
MSSKRIKKNYIQEYNYSSFPISNPMFNYASFCKFLSIYEIQLKFKFLVRSPEYFIRDYIILIEILKLLKQISSLKKLDIQLHKNLPNTNFTSFPGAENCLKISQITTFSYINSEFFYLSQYCHNIKSLIIEFCDNIISDEFIKLWIGEVDLLNEKIALELVTNYSPKNLNRIELLYRHQSYTEKLHPEVLDSFFISWTKRLPYFPINIIIKRLDVTESLDTNEENMNIINKY